MITQPIGTIPLAIKPKPQPNQKEKDDISSTIDAVTVVNGENAANDYSNFAFDPARNIAAKPPAGSWFYRLKYP